MDEISLNAQSAAGDGITLPNHMHLPPEIYAEIFLAARGSRGDVLRDNPHWRKPNPNIPFTLGAVCHYWRDIIRSTPQMWSEINLRLHPTHLAEHFYYLDHFLNRSGTCPLTITMSFEKEDADEWQPALGSSYLKDSVLFPLIKLLLSSASRWRCVDITISEIWFSDFANESHRLSNLTSIRVKPIWDDSYQPTSRRAKFDFLHHSPALRELHIRDFWTPYAKIPWKQLQRLTLKGQEWNESLYVLAEAQNLVWCKLESVTIREWPQYIPPPDVEKPVALRSLRNLVLEDIGYYPFARVLEQILTDLSYPILECLEISAPRFPSDITAWLSKGDVRLTHLAISNLRNELHGLVHCLREMPLLERLDISVHRGRHIHGGFFKTIFVKPHPPKSSNYTLPNLRHFSFSGRIALKNSNLDRLLLNILHFRQLQPQPRTKLLLSFELETVGQFSPSSDVKRKMERLSEIELDLRIRCGGVNWL